MCETNTGIPESFLIQDTIKYTVSNSNIVQSVRSFHFETKRPPNCS